MTIIHRNALVVYTARQMFELVNAIQDYPRFLPWCKATHILKKNEEIVEASIEVAWAGIHKTLTTRNFLFPPEGMEIVLISGPFKQLEGKWYFASIADHGCKVSLDLSFEFTGHLFDKMFQPVFHYIANSLVDAFCKRAVEIYGNAHQQNYLS